MNLDGCTALEMITFQSAWWPPIKCNGLRNAIEWQNKYKLEPTRKVDLAIIKLLGLCNLDFESLPAIALRHPSSFASYQLFPVQGLYESGVFSTFLPGNDVPGQFCYRIREGSFSVSFTLPLLHIII